MKHVQNNATENLHKYNATKQQTEDLSVKKMFAQKV